MMRQRRGFSYNQLLFIITVCTLVTLTSGIYTGVEMGFKVLVVLGVPIVVLILANWYYGKLMMHLSKRSIIKG